MLAPDLSPAALLLPALMAGGVAIGVTVAIERWGGRLGGILGTLPTTIVPASIGIFLGAPTPAAFRDAMLAVPAGMLLNAGFLWLWRVLPGRLPAATLGARLAWMVVLSLTAWGLGAAGIVVGGGAARAAGLPTAALGVGTTLLIVGVGALACLAPLPAPRGTRRVPLPTLLGRGLLAACAIGASVAIASTGLDLLAGMASVFPAIFLTTMVSLWLSQGEAVPVGAVGPMMLGSSSVAAYALLAAWALPALGLVAGPAVAWVCATVLTSVPAGLWLASRPRVA
ncbi:MAG: hypothetical protein H6742_09175 [Alphaproteobacteria bacterium]|nr:hypothetical protein [Alphaproteobacteria bacterium]